MNVFLM